MRLINVLGLPAWAIAAGALAAGPLPGSIERLDSVLGELAIRAERDPAGAATFARVRRLRLEGAERAALVAIETAGSAAAASGALAAAGARVVDTADSVAIAWVPLARLAAVASRPEVLRVRRPIPPTWAVTSQGVGLVRADRMHASGIRGAGVRIGVIDSFLGYTAKLGNELPPVERVAFRPGSSGEGDSDHGVSVAEIIADMAPDATLYLAAVDNDVDYRNAVSWFIEQGVHVINHSGGFGLFGNMEGGGPLHGVVARAFSAGMLYVESAGNSARSHWEGMFTDSDGDRMHEFSPGVERLPFSVTSSDFLELRIDLTWDDWLPNAADPRPTTNYELCLYDGAGTELDCARESQSGQPGQVPYEIVLFTVPSVGDYSVGVIKSSGSDLFLELELEPTYEFRPFVASSSLIVPADHRNAFTVGASDLNDALRPYSSRGPTNDGRLKPDLVAPDGVLTSLGEFFGTSAAAPHVAGAAALLIEAQPGLGVAELSARLRGYTVQSPFDASAGADNNFGCGRLDADFTRPVPPPCATPTPRPPPTPPPGGGGGGGGCRLAPSGGGGSPVPLLLSLAAVVLYGAWSGRRARQ